MTKPLALPVDDLEDLARRHARRAVETLAEVIENAEATPATRISAATALLQWGYGRPGGRSKAGEAGEQVIRLTWGNES